MRPATPGKQESIISIFVKILRVLSGTAALLLIGANTVIMCLLLFVLALFKFLAPSGKARDAVRKALAAIAEAWISVNNAVLSLYRRTRWDAEIPAGLDRNGRYLVLCNHQSWVDILVLQRCFNRRLPLLRFFLKSELIWVPFLGVAWWALDFPFMRRHSKAKITRRPALKGSDLENARRATEKFREIPVAMMNFPEGTRFTPEKREKTKSPYRHLLPPRIGGTGQVLYALGDRLDALIDVTIVYPEYVVAGTAPTFWDLVSGQVHRIVVHAEKHEIPAHLLGRNFRTDRDFRHNLEEWMTGLWQEKDKLIESVLKS